VALTQAHRALRGRVPLHAYCYLPYRPRAASLGSDYQNRAIGSHLYHLLGEWKGELVLGILPGAITGKLVSKERRQELLKGYGMKGAKSMEGGVSWRTRCSAARVSDAPDSVMGWRKGHWV
jgi:hypothetical protein